MPVDDYDDHHLVEAERRERLRIQRLQAWTDAIPPKFRRPGPLHPQVSRWVDGLVRGRPTNLVLVGDVGRTKTWHCYHALRVAIDRGYDRGQELLTSMQWRRIITGKFDQSHLDRLSRVGVLGLDDLGATRLIDWDMENLLEVVNNRWANDLPIMVTSNVADLRSMLDERIASRLADDAVLVTLDGPDRRREGK